MVASCRLFYYLGVNLHYMCRVSATAHIQRGTVPNTHNTLVTLKGGGTLECNFCNTGVAVIARGGQDNVFIIFC